MLAAHVLTLSRWIGERGDAGRKGKDDADERRVVIRGGDGWHAQFVPRYHCAEATTLVSCRRLFATLRSVNPALVPLLERARGKWPSIRPLLSSALAKPFSKEAEAAELTDDWEAAFCGSSSCSARGRGEQSLYKRPVPTLVDAG